MWLIKAHTSQEAPTSTSGSSSHINLYTQYFWRNDKGTAEIDFIVTKEGKIIPIEVKSSNNTHSKSLDTYIKKYKSEYSIRISTKNFGFENNIKSVPLYAVFYI